MRAAASVAQRSNLWYSTMQASDTTKPSQPHCSRSTPFSRFGSAHLQSRTTGQVPVLKQVCLSLRFERWLACWLAADWKQTAGVAYVGTPFMELYEHLDRQTADGATF